MQAMHEFAVGIHDRDVQNHYVCVDAHDLIVVLRFRTVVRRDDESHEQWQEECACDAAERGMCASCHLQSDASVFNFQRVEERTKRMMSRISLVRSMTVAETT